MSGCSCPAGEEAPGAPAAATPAWPTGTAGPLHAFVRYRWQWATAYNTCTGGRRAGCMLQYICQRALLLYAGPAGLSCDTGGRGVGTACALATGSAPSYWCYHWQLVLSLVVPRVAGKLAASLAREAGMRQSIAEGAARTRVATHARMVACSCGAACDVRRDVRAPSDGETERAELSGLVSSLPKM